MLDDPHEPRERNARYMKKAGDEAFFDTLNQILATASLPPGGDPECDPSTLPIIYIVGAPRSGTTLLSQVLSRYLPVGYIDNLIARFWRRPSVGIRLSKALPGEGRREAISFESTHGVTSGIAGPHEFGYFWRHWLHLDETPTHHLDAAQLSKINAAGLKHAIEREILREFGRPAVFKNVICGFHAKFLTELHPRSMFIHIERNPRDTCASILKSRFERYGSYSAWWSLKPRTFPDIKVLDNPADQVFHQVSDCRREINAELSCNGVTSVSLEYEALCRDPATSLELIATSLQLMGADTRLISKSISPFRVAPAPELPDNLRLRLEALFAK